MDIANVVLTFGPAGLVVWSLGKRLVMARRAQSPAPRQRRAAMPTPLRARPPLPTHIMFQSVAQLPQKSAVVPPVVRPATAATAPIVMPNNEYSSGLSDSGRVQFEATAKTVAALYEAGLVTNLSKSICRAYGCSVQAAAKTDSTYQMALKAVNRYLPKKDAGPQFRSTPEIEATRAALGLGIKKEGTS